MKRRSFASPLCLCGVKNEMIQAIKYAEEKIH